MKQRIFLGLAIIYVALMLTVSVIAQEHPGKPLGRTQDVTPDQVKKAILDYIKRDSFLKGGYFLMWDKQEERVWKLKFSRPHSGVREVEDQKYFLCTDFKNVHKQPDGSISTTVFDLDFWAKKDNDGTLVVDQIKIHKVAGIPRFQYDKRGMEILE